MGAYTLKTVRNLALLFIFSFEAPKRRIWIDPLLWFSLPKRVQLVFSSASVANPCLPTLHLARYRWNGRISLLIAAVHPSLFCGGPGLASWVTCRLMLLVEEKDSKSPSGVCSCFSSFLLT